MTNKHVKRYLAAVVTVECNETTMRQHYTPTDATKIKRTEHTHDGKDVDCWNVHKLLLINWWECEMVQPLWKAVWKFLLKLNNYLPYDSEIPFLNIYQREIKTYVHRKTLCSNVHNSFVWNSQKLKIRQMSFTMAADK